MILTGSQTPNRPTGLQLERHENGKRNVRARQLQGTSKVEERHLLSRSTKLIWRCETVIDWKWDCKTLEKDAEYRQNVAHGLSQMLSNRSRDRR